MPFGRMEFIQLVILILIVPAQYFISCYFAPSTSTNQSDYQLHLLVKKLQIFIKNSHEWFLELTDLISKSILSSLNYDLHDKDNVEVPVNKENVIFFGGSSKPRSPRPAHVKYKVGQVIRHKVYGYKGVIIGWDPKTMAPDYWIKQFYQNRQDLIDLPSYSILVDNRDRDKMHRTYVNQDNIEILSNTKIIHSEVDDYFEEFDGVVYIPRPKLRVIYPHD